MTIGFMGAENLRKDLDGWRFYLEDEDVSYSLARFLIAFEELRVRLAPDKYPNIEISDEGHLWFNMDTGIGVVEVLAFPFGFQQIAAPSIAFSLPRKAEKINLIFLEKIKQIPHNFVGVQLFTHEIATTREEILDAFKRNEHPSLSFTSDFDHILALKKKGIFFSYLGVYFTVVDKTVSQVESMTRDIVFSLEGKNAFEET